MYVLFLFLSLFYKDYRCVMCVYLYLLYVINIAIRYGLSLYVIFFLFFWFVRVIFSLFFIYFYFWTEKRQHKPITNFCFTAIHISHKINGSNSTFFYSKEWVCVWVSLFFYIFYSFRRRRRVFYKILFCLFSIFIMQAVSWTISYLYASRRSILHSLTSFVSSSLLLF